MNISRTFVIFLLVFIISITAPLYSSKSSTEAVVDEVITWGVGISGAISMVACENVDTTKPNPASFYVFNLAAISYLAIDQLVSDEDKKANEKIEGGLYGGADDEQNSSYLRARDIALLNAEHAKEKGKYKMAASAAMLVAAGLAYREQIVFENSVAAIRESGQLACENQKTQQAAATAAKPYIPDESNNGGLFFMDKRCKNLGGAKVICSPADKTKLKALTDNCIKNAKQIIQSPKCTTSLKGAIARVNSEEKSGEVTSIPSSEDMVGSPDEVKKLDDASKGWTVVDDMKKDQFYIDNPVSKLLTLGGLQYSPGIRAITYGALGAVVFANATLNNSAADEFEEEAKEYDALANGQGDCGDNCIGSGDGDLVVTSIDLGEPGLNFEQSVTDNQWGIIHFKWKAADGSWHQRGMDHLPDASKYNGQKHHVLRDLYYVCDSLSGANSLPSTNGWRHYDCDKGGHCAVPRKGTTVYYAVSGDDDGQMTSFVPFEFEMDKALKGAGAGCKER